MATSGIYMRQRSTRSAIISDKYNDMSYFLLLLNGRPRLMVDRQKIETNIAHNFFCSLALTDNNYLIFTVVDEKNWTVLLLQRCWKISHTVYRLHYNATAYQMSLCYRYRGGNEGLQCSSFICNYNISKYPEKEKSAVIMHSHLSEFNYDAGTAMSRYIINSTCVTTKLRQNFKVNTFLSSFLCSFCYQWQWCVSWEKQQKVPFYLFILL